MTIKEVEEKTGLARSNIRFYEKEGLIRTARNESNGYRDYTEENVNELKKIAYLRTLGISVEEIRELIHHEIFLMDVIRAQEKKLEEQILDLNQARELCRRMTAGGNVDYDELCIEDYILEIPEYLSQNHRAFRMDSVGIFSAWGSTLVWRILVVLCLLTAFLAYPYLPERIPVQYSGGEVVSEVERIFIFGYPILCVIARWFFRRWLRWGFWRREGRLRGPVSDYLANFFCVVIFSMEIFIVLFVHGYAKNVVLWLAADAAVFGMLLFAALSKGAFSQ